MKRRWVPLDALESVTTQFTFYFTFARVFANTQYTELDLNEHRNVANPINY